MIWYLRRHTFASWSGYLCYRVLFLASIFPLCKCYPPHMLTVVCIFVLFLYYNSGWTVYWFRLAYQLSVAATLRSGFCKPTWIIGISLHATLRTHLLISRFVGHLLRSAKMQHVYTSKPSSSISATIASTCTLTGPSWSWKIAHFVHGGTPALLIKMTYWVSASLLTPKSRILSLRGQSLKPPCLL